MEKGLELEVRILDAVRDYKAWTDNFGVVPHNCFSNRDGIEVAHSFVFKCWGDLAGAEQDDYANNQRRAGLHHPSRRRIEDVMCVVKAYMRDASPQQPPALLLPLERQHLVPGRAPTMLLPLTYSTDRRAELLDLADILDGDTLGYHRAATFIRQRLVAAPPPAPEPGWLTLEGVAGLPAPLPPGGDPLFPHLPMKTFPLQVRFKRRTP